MLERFISDREVRFESKTPAKIPVVSQDAATPRALAGEDSWEYFDGSSSVASGDGDAQ